MPVDFLIIGQGLAGSLLAWELLQRGCKVMVLDSGHENASQVAAGLINPVTGMRLVKSGDVDTLLPAARQLYRQLSGVFKQDFYQEKTMLRLLRTEAEVSACQKRLADPAYRDYLGALLGSDRLCAPINQFAAVLEQKQTAYLLTRPLLACLKDYFISRNSYRQTSLDYRDIHWQPKPRWQDITAGQIIFCEGYQAQHNPWFSGLPYQPAQGEILTLESETEFAGPMLNFGHWLIPVGANRFRVGATFARMQTDASPTEAGKVELLQALDKVFPAGSQTRVIAHQANIRPCTADRRPFIGQHPRQAGCWIFNGFGAKGSLQIPWYSQHLVDSLLTGRPLQPACNIERLCRAFH